jgi:hypothetical protein
VATVADLQKFPIELHVNPICSDTTNVVCQASGDYVNEDGISASIHDTFTEYVLNFETFVGGVFHMAVTNSQSRTNTVNENDFLGKL